MNILDSFTNDISAKIEKVNDADKKVLSESINRASVLGMRLIIIKSLKEESLVDFEKILLSGDEQAMFNFGEKNIKNFNIEIENLFKEILKSLDKDIKSYLQKI